ncbi:MAG: BA14K family protein [Pseudomonadota bacterium]
MVAPAWGGGPRWGWGPGGCAWGGCGWGPGAGFATGVIVGSAIAAPPPAVVYGGPPPGSAVAYCMRRFRSYNPATGTYLGYDGRRHPCP